MIVRQNKCWSDSDAILSNSMSLWFVIQYHVVLYNKYIPCVLQYSYQYNGSQYPAILHVILFYLRWILSEKYICSFNNRWIFIYIYISVHRSSVDILIFVDWIQYPFLDWSVMKLFFITLNTQDMFLHRIFQKVLYRWFLGDIYMDVAGLNQRLHYIVLPVFRLGYKYTQSVLSKSENVCLFRADE